MEQLRTELSHLLGEKLSRVECVSEQAATALWFLYDAQGKPDAAAGAKFHHARRGAAAGMEDLDPRRVMVRCVCRWFMAS